MDPIGKNSENQEPILIDVQRVLEGRMLIQANSGGGKSYTIRKFLEVTHGQAQQIILDLEGEYASLREKFDYILVGKDGDIQVNIRAAELLAKRLLELNTSAIIDLYELKHQERKRFVKLFIDAMVNSPKSLWHPCLVIVDEAHVLAPEKEQSEALDAIKDLATRGRKRGFALVAATQRISKLSKDVVAELNTKLIGRCSLDVDMKRAAFELGFTDKKDVLSLRKLPKGEFFAFGPGLTSEVTKIKIDKVVTKHAEAGETYLQQTSAAPDKVRKVLAKLADLPAAAEEELKTTQDLKNKIVELKRDLSRSKNQSIAVKLDSDVLQKAEQKGFKTAETLYQKNIKILEAQISKLTQLLEHFHQVSGTALETKTTLPEIKNPIALQDHINVIAKKPIEQFQPVTSKEVYFGELTGPESKILQAVLSFPNQRGTKMQVCFAAGYTNAKSGGFQNPLGSLRSKGLVEYEGKDVFATDEGKIKFPDIQPLLLDQNNIQEFWTGKLAGPEKRILTAIMEAYPNKISKEETAQRAGYSNPKGGGFQNPLGHLRTLGLIEYYGQDVKATEELFPIV